MPRFCLAFACLVLVSAARAASAQSGANVLLVVNDTSPDSVRIGDHYARARAVPSDQVLKLKLDAAEEIDRARFMSGLASPIAGWLQRHAAQDRILYIVLTKGVPLRVSGTSGREGTVASVDSELALLYRRMTGQDVAVDGRIVNPYFKDGHPSQMSRFTHEVADIYLVTRLDGYTVDDVIRLIDRGVAPVRQGRVLLDQKAGTIDAAGNVWLKSASDRLTALGFGNRVVLDSTDQVLRNDKQVLGYYSWGSNDWAITARTFDLGFVPGAIAGMFVSTDGRTFREPPADWKIGTWTNPSSFFSGSPQSLAGDLIRQGVTGVSAHVAEPYLDATIRPDILFPAYLTGFNLAESYYLGMRFLSWQTVIVGDPLCAPFPKKALTSAEIDPGLDPETELPARFSAGRLKVLTDKGTKPEAAKLMLRAEARSAAGNRTGAREALEAATALDATLVAAHLTLAAEFEAQQDYAQAVDRYRKVLAAAPNDPIALNNLAYALAVHQKKAAEALPLAEQAMRVTGGRSVEIADTYAWVLHLVGRDKEAADVLARIIAVVKDRALLRLHAAVVFAAVDRTAEAAVELKEALRLDPSLEQTDEVRALRAKLK